MTLTRIASLLLEPRGTRYIGRHRAPDPTRVVTTPLPQPRPTLTAE